MAAADDDESSSSLVATIRSAVRGLLEFGDNTAPILSSIFRPCVRIMEKLTGVSLLPDVKVKLKKSKKGKKKSSKQKTTSDDEESDESDVVEAKKEKKSKSAAKALKKPSETTKKHISGSLKSTNPNYRIQKELKEFIQSPPPNLSVQVGPNIRAWVVTMVGANNTIYEGEVFKLRINFPKDYPRVPPSVYFLKGYIPTHEHVYTNGDICLSLLGKDWRPTMTAQSIANSILSILSSAQHKSLPMDNANHANAKPGEYQKDWTYHDDSC
jgi:ubiquitin-conjugating enzyme E2 W